MLPVKTSLRVAVAVFLLAAAAFLAGDFAGGLLGQEHPHPRACGTFPRILRKYVREQHPLTLPEAIRKCSARPAQRMRFTDRGVLKKGMAADVVTFDPATFRDVATYENPNQLSPGMEWVLVNGVPMMRGGKDDRRAAGQGAARPGIGWAVSAHRPRGRGGVILFTSCAPL